MPVPKKPAAKVVVKIDANLKALWELESKRLAAATSQEVHDWDERYEAIGAILDHDPPLYLAGGFSTDHDFIEKVVREDKSSLYRNLRVAKYANPEEIERYSVSRLDLAIAIVEAKIGGPLKSRTPLAFDKLRCSYKDGATVVTRRFEELTVEQLRAALALARGREATSKKASPAARAVDAAIKKSGVKGVTFSVSKKTLSLRVPLEAVARLSRALASFAAT